MGLGRRIVIAQAIGILMAGYDVDKDEAVRPLARRARDTEKSCRLLRPSWSMRRTPARGEPQAPTFCQKRRGDFPQSSGQL